MAALALLGQASAINLTTIKNFGNNRFGGSLTSTLSDITSAGAYTLNGSFVAKGRISGTTSTVASANASVTVRSSSTGQIKGKLVVKGIVRVDYTKDFSTNMEFDPGRFTNTWSLGSQLTNVDGIILRFQGRVSVATSNKCRATVSTPLHVEGLITPTFDVVATGTATGNPPGIPARVDGSLILFKASIPISAVLTPNFEIDSLGNIFLSGTKVAVDTTVSGTSTEGSLKIFTIILGIKHSTTIASFLGSTFGPVILAKETIVLE